MFQSEATNERARTTAAYGSQASAILTPAGDAVLREDDDALFDSWISSLSTREFECILGRLADDRGCGVTGLEASA